MNTEELLRHRMLKFRKIGGFQEGLPVDPKRKVNMKMKEEPLLVRSSSEELEGEVEKLKQQILKAKESSVKPPVLELNEIIEKVKKEVDLEFSEAVKATGFKDRLTTLNQEYSKVNSQDQLMTPVLMDKIEKLKNEFNQSLSTAPNYESLKYKLNMLQELSKAKILSEKNNKADTLKQDINKKFKEVLNRRDIKEKMEALKAEVLNSGASNPGELDQGLKENVLKMKSQIRSEFINVLESMGLEVEVIKSKTKDFNEQSSISDIKTKIENLNGEINKRIEEVVNSSDVKNMIEVLKLEVAKAGKTPDTASKNKIEALERQIKQRVSDVLSSSGLKEKHGELTLEMDRVLGSNGTFKNDSPKENVTYDDSRIKLSVGANSGFA
jgi:acetyl-CoA carboxylase carboxyl transferase subunit alpha